MGDILKVVLDKAPGILDKAPRSTLGLTALSVLVVGTACFLLFPGAGELLRLFVFAMIMSGYVGFLWVSGRL